MSAPPRLGSVFDRLDDYEPIRTSHRSPGSPLRSLSNRLGRRGLVAISLFCFVMPWFILTRFDGITSQADSVTDLANQHQQPEVHLPVQTVTVTVPAMAAPTPTPVVITQKVPVAATASEPVIFSLISFSTESAREAAVLLKSILMYTSVPVHFHIVCDEPAESFLTKRLELVTHPTHDVKVIYYRLSMEDMKARIAREGTIVTDHSAGLFGLMKLFIHEILPPTVHRSIFVDTDAFFMADPAQLWRTFSQWKPTTMLGMPTHLDQFAPEWHDANKICSCVMLLDLDEMRKMRLMDSSAYRADATGPTAYAPALFEKMYGAPKPGFGYKDVKLGDQGYWWAIVNGTDRFEHLSLEWEFSSCLVDMYGTSNLVGEDDTDASHERALMLHTNGTPHEGHPLFPKLLHFNCITGDSVYWESDTWSDPDSSLARRWGSTVMHHVGYKWLWLNTDQHAGPGSEDSDRARVTMERVEKVVFADEEFGSKHGHHFKGHNAGHHV